jgi:Protein of unknown function (DUF2917)
MDIVLQHQEMLALPGNRGGVRFSCAAGDLWITQEGDARDHLLRPGQDFATRLPGEIVVTALAESRLRLSPAGRRLPRRASSRLPSSQICACRLKGGDRASC